ncbi:transcription regulatory protein [Cryptosporidium ubiquitum]|uniref:Transcription regulatory protein n=1 Tax=Cryptosporidium ubiquitum TaxID=857276 RepID=A0A1J4MI17_9CRYT|nr:transcription regulatory protein [Cryptosporidium ubiquitum]OII73099.1 transcription regulatory protein [Cryptosporidium ubiquitum]
MVERSLPYGENVPIRQLIDIIKEIGPSSTSNQENFDKILVEWIDNSSNFTHEIAISFIYMLNDTSKHNKSPKSKEKGNNDFSEVLRARWNELSNNKNDQNLLVQRSREDIGSGWNSSVFVEGVNKIMKTQESKNKHFNTNWSDIINEIIDNSNLLDLTENDGSFELFCSLLGESYRRDENRTYNPKYNELYYKLDPFLREWKNPNIQALFLLKICKMSYEINNRSYNLQQKNYSNDILEDTLIENTVNFDSVYTDINSYSIILDASSKIHNSIISMFESDESLLELVKDGLLGTPCDYLLESKLPKIGIFHSRGSCGLLICHDLLKVIIGICNRINDQKLLELLKHLIFYEIPRYSPIGLLSSLGAIYDDFPQTVSISNELVSKICDSFDISVPNNEITKVSLIKMAISSAQEFILFPISKIVATSHEKEYDIGPRFGAIMQIIFASSEKSRNGNNQSQFMRDFISQIAFCYRISSILLISKLNPPSRDYLWNFLDSEWCILPHFYKMNVSNCLSHILSRDQLDLLENLEYSHDSIDYYHWWFLCIDIIFSGISASQNFELGLSSDVCNEISARAVNVLSTLFKEELENEDMEMPLFIIAIMDYIRARLVYMTYVSADLQTILVNRRTSFPSFAVDKAASFKVFAARIVRRNLSLGSSQLYQPKECWISSFETHSFAFSCWRISSSSILAIQNAILEFGADIKGYENTPISELFDALLEFEKLKDSDNLQDNGNSLVSMNKDIGSEMILNSSVNGKDERDLNNNISKALFNNKDPEHKDNTKMNINSEFTEAENESKGFEINQVNEFLTKCYSGEITISELTIELKKMHSLSSDPSNNAKIFNTFLQTLFDECRSYPKYPNPELKITAEILGILVKEDLLISFGNALVFVLRCIIEALRKGHWTKMFCFGIFAMEQFIDRFISFPQFLSAIVNMSQHLKNAIEPYVVYCESCILVLPENLRSKLYIEKNILESLNINPPPKPESLISKTYPEILNFEYRQKENIVSANKPNMSTSKLGSLVALNLSERKSLPSGITIDQLQGFGLGSLEKLMNDPQIFNTIITPSENVIEHIFTICNTLASTNIETKAIEMAEILNRNPEYCHWFAFYLVKNRASKEKNNHSTYINFLIKLNKLMPKISSTSLNEEKVELEVPLTHNGNEEENRINIIEITTLASYDCIKALLRYASILNEVSSFVNVLRHLGYWLGQITIGINRPIIHKYLNPRQLLVEGYSRGCVASVLPFVCKILENVKGSYYCPPNPWTNNILFTLAEIHSLANNTNSHMFEVELLFKQIELNLDDYIGKSNYLGLNSHPNYIEQHKVLNEKQRGHNIHLKSQTEQSPHINLGSSFERPSNNNNNIINNSLNPSVNLYQLNANIGDTQLASTFMPPNHPSQMVHQQNQQQISSSDIQFWANKVLISPSIVLFQIQPSLRPLVPLALDRSIREILQVVIPRSVRIAAITTREIIGKEFAFETDENIYKRAAHLMVAALSGSMAIAACREPLRVAFTAQLRQVLHPTPSRDGEDHVLIEQVVQVICSDNIDLGCQIIEQAVVEKAIEELDEIISPGIIARRKSRESGHQFVDTDFYGGPNTQNSVAYWSSLPDNLKYRHNSMRHLQLYKDFLQFTLIRNMERRDSVAQYELQNNIQSNQSIIPLYQHGNNDHFNNQSQNQQWNSSSTNQYSHQPENIQNFSSVRSDNINSQASNQSQTNVASSTIVQPPEPVKVPLVFELAYLPLMMRIDECLGQIKDVIREIALYPPIFPKHLIPPISNNFNESLNNSNNVICSNPLGSNISQYTPKSTAHPVLAVLSSLQSDHILFYLCRVLYSIGKSASQREDVLIGISQKLFKTLFDAGAAFQQSTTSILPSSRCIASSLGFDAAQLHIEVFLGLCNQISFYNSKFWLKLRKEAIGWFIYTIEDPKYSVDIVIGALRYDLISSSELDISLSNILETAISTLNDTNSVIGGNSRCIRIIEFIYKLFFRSIEDWHYPITKKLPSTTQNLNRLSNNGLIFQNNTMSAIQIVLPGLYYKPYPYTTNLGELKSKVESILLELESNKSIVFHEMWIGDQRPEILNFYSIIQCNLDTALNPKYIALPIPMKPLPDITKGINMIFDEWILLLRITIFSGVGGSERNNPYRNLFLQRLSRQGLLRMDDTTEKLFTTCIERAVYLSLNQKTGDFNVLNRSKSENTSDSNNNMDPFPIDSLVRLITTMARYVDPQQMAAVVITHKFLSILTRVIHKDAESPNFNQRPYYRIFYSLLQEYESIGFNTEMIHFTCILSVVHHLQYLNPNRLPGFTYSWIQIISSNRLFPYLLRHVKGWQPYQALLLQLFIFISPFLRSVQLSSNIKTIYGALLRILLVLLHDFPEFLCDYSCSFCDVLPVNCIQIRNLILSAFPRNMKLPDPFLPTLKIESLPEMKLIPRMIANYGAYILHNDLKASVDKFWVTRDVSILPHITEIIKLPKDEALKCGTKYSFQIITGLLLYIGIYLPNGNDSNSTIDNYHNGIYNVFNSDLSTNSNIEPTQKSDQTVNRKNAPLDNVEDPSLSIILFLCRDLDMEGRFALISAMANFLGYPNSYTYYFSSLILWLFSKSNDSIVQEQITRILLERLIVHRPHPWGLLITFIELIKNPKYSFWNCSFVHLAPEVEKLFQSVAQTCLGQGPNKTSSVNPT